MAVAEPITQATADATSNLQGWTANCLLEWSAACGGFLQWQREHLVEREPTTRELHDHREALTWMLRLTKLLHTAVSDPLFPNPSLAKELAGRVLQLEESWLRFCDPNRMTEEDADKFLAKVFPE